jgi:small-conductance mechanosensitive channel
MNPLTVSKWLVSIFLLVGATLLGENGGGKEPAPASKEAPPAPTKVEIKPTARDFEIAERIKAILEATGWFYQPNVQVKEGVVFLTGETKKEELKKWAGDLARSTTDVSAVVNKIEIERPSIWDFQPTIEGLRQQGRDLIRLLPSLAFALFVFVLTWLFAMGVVSFSKRVLSKRVDSPLLKDVLARGIGFIVFLLGFYVIFRMLGLTTIALTILGGTGALGIILGIAFRDITENLLASIFLSIHHPFRNGDLVEIEGIQGYVQRLTFRSTVLMSLDGNHIQIPNATVYKTVVRNFYVNPNYQTNFVLVIGYNEPIPKAQEIALKVLSEHPAVLKDPEPWVLVDSLENATVILRIYFWVDATEHSWLKVKSSVMRLIKLAFQEQEVTMPGPSGEISILGDVPVRLEKGHVRKEEPRPEEETNPIATVAEGGLVSEAEEIKQQAAQSRSPEKGEANLLNKGQNNSKEDSE